ncbi:Protein arginine N-methyltransferase 5 [Globomyces sp. JEL0801]|nr:Protein arginine N-methyltransferase 5 [Globomyces sp. JEL0801]
MEVGLEVLCCSSVDELIGNAKDHHYDFVLANILHMENGHFLTDNAPIPASLPSDSLFVHQLDLDSSDLIIRQKSELLVKKQIDWAVHIGLRSIMFTLPLNGSIYNLARSNPKVIVSNSDYNARHPSATLMSYRQYIDHLFQNQPEPDIIDQFATESATYEVFEKDPVKYNLYETAIYRALIDRAPLNSTQPTVIMVVGAGRGPLVDRALKASQSSKRPVKVYAIEKNPNAIITLRKKKTTEWHDRVQVVHTDMRFWTPPEKVIDSPNHQCDILVSELLGSFGDNELSPECLDGAQKVLKGTLHHPSLIYIDTGISIPQNYTAFVAPLSSTRLYNNAKQYNDVKYLETGFVVKFRDVYEINTSKPVWTFTHPNPISMHGIAAYFESILYKDVIMSIDPITHSPQM